MVEEPKPIEPTAAELKAEIQTLRTKIAGMVPSAERDQLKLDLDLARAELADLKKPKPLEADPGQKGFFPKLF